MFYIKCRPVDLQEADGKKMPLETQNLSTSRNNID
jgi:hypothetical protein